MAVHLLMTDLSLGLLPQLPAVLHTKLAACRCLILISFFVSRERTSTGAIAHTTQLGFSDVPGQSE